MEADFFDGESARRHRMTVILEGDELVGQGSDAAFRWPVGDVRVIEARSGRVRLARKGTAARLSMNVEDWEALSGLSVTGAMAKTDRGERRLILRLSAVGVGLALALFIGVPLAAVPLARATPPALEARLGRSMVGQLTVALPPCEGDPESVVAINGLANRLSRTADTAFPVRVLVVQASMVNAFALPGGTVLVTSGLIAEAEGPDELAGVLAHEIAHIERRHVMVSVWRSLGLGLVLDAVLGGGTGAGQQAVLLAGNLTEQRFSREAESEADQRAFEFLAAEGISTRGMAAFFGRLSDESAPREVRAAAEWLQTHPDSAKRARAALDASRPGVASLTPEQWASVKRSCLGTPRRLPFVRQRVSQ